MIHVKENVDFLCRRSVFVMCFKLAFGPLLWVAVEVAMHNLAVVQEEGRPQAEACSGG
jgi:hypothetical protein